jgi:hypothetical protein
MARSLRVVYTFSSPGEGEGRTKGTIASGSPERPNEDGYDDFEGMTNPAPKHKRMDAAVLGNSASRATGMSRDVGGGEVLLFEDGLSESERKEQRTS